MWTTTKRCLLRCIATLCVATVFLVRAEDADAPFATQLAKLIADDGAANDISVIPLLSATVLPSSEHLGTTIKGHILVPRTSSR